MIKIIKFQSIDGVVFDEEKDCLEYEDFLNRMMNAEDWDEYKQVVYEFSLRFCPEFENHDYLLRVKSPDLFPFDKFMGNGYPDWPAVYISGAMMKNKTLGN